MAAPDLERLYQNELLLTHESIKVISLSNTFLKMSIACMNFIRVVATNEMFPSTRFSATVSM